MRQLVQLFWVINFAFFQTAAAAATWVDEDGDTFILVNEKTLSIYSTNSFYYFDELFTDVRKGAKIRLCVGVKSGTGMASDCIGNFNPSPGFNNQGKTRSLHFNIEQFPFVIEAFEDYLRAGETMKLSIDNFDLFSAYSLNAKYELSEEALRTLELPD